MIDAFEPAHEAALFAPSLGNGDRDGRRIGNGDRDSHQRGKGDRDSRQIGNGDRDGHRMSVQNLQRGPRAVPEVVGNGD